MDRITEVTKDCFDTLIQLRQAEASAIPPPETLFYRLRGEVDEVLRRAAVFGFSHNDAQDIAYALVALIDEQVLSKPEPHRQFWMSNLLQFHYFKENVAGDGFFTRLHELRKDQHRAEVLQVYYLCMLFGFQGRYRIRGGDLELRTLIDTVKTDLDRARPQDFDELSPNGERPTESLASVGRRVSLLTVSIAAMATAVLVSVGLRLYLDSELQRVTREIDQETARTQVILGQSAQTPEAAGAAPQTPAPEKSSR